MFMRRYVYQVITVWLGLVLLLLLGLGLGLGLGFGLRLRLRLGVSSVAVSGILIGAGGHLCQTTLMRTLRLLFCYVHETLRLSSH